MNSPLIVYTKLSPNRSIRHGPVRKITIHHAAGVLSIEQMGNFFASRDTAASATYGIGSDGRIGLFVPETSRPWTSKNTENDNQAVTIEVSNSQINKDWPVSDLVLGVLIKLCVDVCRRNGIAELIYDGTPNGTLTRHNMFINTECPGPYLQSKFPFIASEVNIQLRGGKEEEEEPMRYKTIEEMPTWAQGTIQKLVALGILAGRGQDEVNLDLTDDMVRLLVINDRAGLYK